MIQARKARDPELDVDGYIAAALSLIEARPERRLP